MIYCVKSFRKVHQDYANSIHFIEMFFFQISIILGESIGDCGFS